MKYIFKFFLIMSFLLTPLYAVHVTKSGLIPTYAPNLGISLYFVPYNAKVIMVSDKVLSSAVSYAVSLECAEIYCFTPDPDEYQALTSYNSSYPNIRANFGLLHSQSGNFPYFPSSHVMIENVYRYSGSLLQPNYQPFHFLFGASYQVPTKSVAEFMQQNNISKVDLLYLDCGGTELQILQSRPDLVSNAIVVCTKTYHQNFRNGLPGFQALDQFMKSCDFVLMTHHIYDNFIGDAFYVKRKYYRAIFQNKEI